MMSREFCLETTLKVWDFIFSGIEEGMVTNMIGSSTNDDDIDYENLYK